jgi:hypothetical protein
VAAQSGLLPLGPLAAFDMAYLLLGSFSFGKRKVSNNEPQKD